MVYELVACSFFPFESSEGSQVFMCPQPSSDPIECVGYPVELVSGTSQFSCFFPSTSSSSLVDLTAEEIDQISSAVLLLFATAYGIKRIRMLIEDRLSRG